jgi:hypothetical protein
MHRVAKCSHERYSIVFKQRTVPTSGSTSYRYTSFCLQFLSLHYVLFVIATAPRYQEDYVIADGQRRALRQRAFKRAAVATTAALAIGAIGSLFAMNYRSSLTNKSSSSPAPSTLTVVTA